MYTITMPLDFENIRLNTTCTDCGHTEMAMGYSYGDGSIHKKVLQNNAYAIATRTIVIVCKNCGLVVKTYAEEPGKL